MSINLWLLDVMIFTVLIMLAFMKIILQRMMELFKEDFPDKNDFDKNEGECAGEAFIEVYEPHTMEWTFYRVGQIDVKHENFF